MSDPTAPGAPTPTPAPTPAPTPTPAPNTNPVVQRQAAPKSAANSLLITNPAPVKEVEPEKVPDSLPSTTIAEMAAGRAALEKNKPVAEALEDANRRRAAGETGTASNPVDAASKG